MPIVNHAAGLVPSLTACLTLSLAGVASAESAITSWGLVDGEALAILRHADAPMFSVETVELHTDSAGGHLRYRLSPRANPGCVQDFAIQWTFRDAMSVIHEGQRYPMTACVGVGVCGAGPESLNRCFADALRGFTIALDNTVNFRVLGANSIAGAYHTGDGQYLIAVEGAGSVYAGQASAWTLRVDDSPYHTQVGYIDSRYGNFVFEVAMGHVFSDHYVYRYDAGLRPTPPAPPSTSGEPGFIWFVQESGWDGTWTRRGASNVFDAIWTSGGATVTAVMTVVRQGNNVTITRTNSSDGNDCTYSGTIGADGHSVSGTYTCTRYPGPFPWHGIIDPVD